jgi:hypothetical protein
MRPLDEGDDAGGEVTGDDEEGVVEVGVDGADFFVCRDFDVTANTLMLFPAVLRFPAASLAALAFTLATMTPGFVTPATVTRKLLRLRRPATLIVVALAVPERRTPAALKPWTASLKETVKRIADCEVGFAWPAARLMVGFGRVQS